MTRQESICRKMKVFHSMILFFLLTYFFAIYISHRAMVISNSTATPSHRLKDSFYAQMQVNQSVPIDPFQRSRKYIHKSILCPACRDARFSHKKRETTCEQAIRRYAASSNTTELEALEKTMARYETCRQACNGSCSESERVTRIFWRMDDVAPPTVRGRTYYLKSVPATHRIPKQALSNMDQYFATQDNVYPQRSYVFEYNPSIVRLPDGCKLPPSLVSEHPVYIASFRLATTQQCITGETEKKMFGGSYPYPADDNALGIALLREDLSVIADVAVNIKPIDNYVQDFRIFAFDNQLYLSSHYFIRPLWLVRPVGPDRRDSIMLKHKFGGDGDRNQQYDFDVYIRKFPSCARYKEGKRNGKNLNFFQDWNTSEIMMELRPMGPKIRIDLQQPCEHNAEIQEPHVDPPADAVSEPTFRTMEEYYYGDATLFKIDRGSACCVLLPDPRNQSGLPLLLGVSHAKTLRGPVDGFANQYASRFYAMESSSPYKVVAFTGRFCLGFPLESENDNPYALLNMQSIFMGEPVACPRIHFISGMVEKANDPSQLLIAYGVNDCAPRIVQVPKDFVSRMLFPAFGAAR